MMTPKTKNMLYVYFHLRREAVPSVVIRMDEVLGSSGFFEYLKQKDVFDWINAYHRVKNEFSSDMKDYFKLLVQESMQEGSLSHLMTVGRGNLDPKLNRLATHNQQIRTSLVSRGVHLSKLQQFKPKVVSCSFSEKSKKDRQSRFFHQKLKLDYEIKRLESILFKDIFIKLSVAQDKYKEQESLLHTRARLVFGHSCVYIFYLYIFKRMLRCFFMMTVYVRVASFFLKKNLALSTPDDTLYVKEPHDDFHRSLSIWVATEDGSDRHVRIAVQKKIYCALKNRSEKLELRNLGLHTIPPLYALTNLKKIHLGMNKLSRIDAFQFSTLVNLKFLNVSVNRLSHEIDKNAFAKLSNLEVLFLESNDISYLHPTVFSDLKSLKSLSLSKNRFEKLDKDLLNGLHQLNVVDLSFNQFQKLDANLFRDQQHLNSLFLCHNNFTDFSCRMDNFNSCNINLEQNPLSKFTVLRLFFEFMNGRQSDFKVLDIFSWFEFYRELFKDSLTFPPLEIVNKSSFSLPEIKFDWTSVEAISECIDYLEANGDAGELCFKESMKLFLKEHSNKVIQAGLQVFLKKSIDHPLYQLTMFILMHRFDSPLQSHVTVPVLNPIEALNHLTYFSKIISPVEKSMLDLYFKLRQEFVPTIILKIEGFVGSDEFLEYMSQSNPEFNLDYFRLGISILYATLGRDKATHLLESVDLSIEKIVDLYGKLPRLFRNKTVDDLEVMSGYLNRCYNENFPLDILNKLNAILIWHSTSFFSTMTQVEEKVAVIEKLETQINSEALQIYLLATEKFFDKGLFRFWLLRLFGFLESDLFGDIVCQCSKSLQKIAKLYRVMLDFESICRNKYLNQSDCVKMNVYLKDYHKTSEPIRTLGAFLFILEWHGGDMLPTMDELEDGIDHIYVRSLKRSFFKDMTQLNAKQFLQIKEDISDWICAYDRVNKDLSSEMRAYFELLVQESIKMGSIAHLMTMNESCEGDSRLKKIAMHNQCIRDSLASRGVFLSKLDDYKAVTVKSNFMNRAKQTHASKFMQQKLVIKTCLNMLEKIVFNDRQFLSQRCLFEKLREMTDEIDVYGFFTDSEKRKMADKVRELSRNIFGTNSQHMCEGDLKTITGLFNKLRHALCSMKVRKGLNAGLDVTIQVRPWKRDALTEFNLGSKVECCLSPTSFEFFAIVERLIDQAMLVNVVEVKNESENTWEIAGLNWLYLAEDIHDENKVYLVANYYENSRKYSKKNIQFFLMDTLTKYTMKMANELGIDYVVRPLKYGCIPDFPKLYKNNHVDCNIVPVELKLRKVGGYISSKKYYIVSESKDNVPFTFYQLRFPSERSFEEGIDIELGM